MRERTRNWASVVIAGLCLALAIPALLEPEMAFTGVTLKLDGSILVVDTVDPRSSAYRDIEAGMTVRDVNYAVVDDIPPKSLEQYMRGDFFELGVPHPSEPDDATLQLTFSPVAPLPGGFTFVMGVGLLFGAASWVRRGQAGETLRPVAIPLATATAAPLILMTQTWSPFSLPVAFASMALPTLGMLALSDGFIERVPDRTRRRAAIGLAVASAVAYLAVALRFFEVRVSQEVHPELEFLPGVALALSAAITLGPAMILVSTGRRGPTIAIGAPGGGSIDRPSVLLAALTPTVITTTVVFAFYGLGLSVALIWLLVVVVILQGNARVEILRIQRDTVVAATEVERARLAADLHDDALQEMTVLVRRLDVGGDERAAELARSIADRLREVCGDLRLPVLDELGAGPALEWLVARVGEASGHDVRLHREEGGRPPPAVELAVFRVAQEALANAVAHGAPPVVVTYVAATDSATLSISDQGTGIPADAASLAPRSGHYGLLNMRQRAEQIGARIEVRRPPGGGTLIGLTWAST